MYQLVNLYQPIFRRQPKILSATTLITIVGVVVVLMLVLYLRSLSTLRELQQTSETLSQSYHQLDKELGLMPSASVLNPVERISDEVIQLQSEIDDKKGLLAQIDSLSEASGNGFADVFEVFARTSVRDLWLTGIQLDARGNIHISGTTLDPAQVPHYLKTLAREPQLRSLSSASVTLTREESTRPEVDFVLGYDVSETQK